jgi:hypothetical protein
LSAQTRSVVLNWTASTSTGGTLTYNVYRATATCATAAATNFSKVGMASAGAVTYTDSAVAAGVTYCYYVTAYMNSLESVPSNKAEAAIIPLPPTALTVAPSSATLRIGTTMQFLASGGSTTPQWIVSPTGAGKITQTGLYTAPAAIKGNTLNATVTAFILPTNEAATAAVKVTKH